MSNRGKRNRLTLQTRLRDAHVKGTGTRLEAHEVKRVIDAFSKTTPARAEAQDEGAAGEPFDLRSIVAHVMAFESYRTAGNQALPLQWAIESADSDWQSELDMADEYLALRPDIDAHPSPTPASDADRAREAIADVISHESDWRTALTAMDAAEETPEDGSGKPGYWLHQIKVLDRIVATLKSEGK